MTVGAAAITIFHPPSDPQRFDRWVTGYLASARHCFGHVSARQSVQGNGQLDWAVEVSFESAEQLDAWLDSNERQALLADGQGQGYWRSASDLILARGELPPANTGVFLHSVTPGKEAEFVSAQSDLTTVSSGFPGYEGTALFPADSSGQWMSVLRFRTAGQLTGWIRSRERREALLAVTRRADPRFRRAATYRAVRLDGSSRRRTNQNHAGVEDGDAGRALPVSNGDSAVQVAGARAESPRRRIGTGGVRRQRHQRCPTAVGARPGGITAVSALAGPIDGAPARISLAGAAVLVVGYAALVLIFTVVG